MSTLPFRRPVQDSASQKVLIVSLRDVRPYLGRTILWRSQVKRVYASDPDQAMETARALSPNLTVVDGEHAGSAIDLIQRLRHDPDARHTAIVVLVRNNGMAKVDQFRAAGANAVLAAPVEPVQWDARLAELLRVPPRREARIPLMVHVWAAPERDSQGFEGLALNISVHGMLVETAEPLAIGTRLDLYLRLPGDTAPLRVLGQVIREAGLVDGRYRCGVKHVVLTGEAHERIGGFVNSAAWPRFQGRPTRSAGSAERQQWEAELKASEARNTAILQAVLDAVVSVDNEGRIVEFNRAAEATFGYERANVLGKRAIDLLLPEAGGEPLWAGLAQLVATGIAAGVGRRLEITGRRSDGTEFPAEVSLSSVEHEGHHYLTAGVRDLTEKRRADESQRASARQFRALFEGAMDAMVITDEQGRYLEVNPAACLMHGRTRESLLGQSIAELADPPLDLEGGWAAFQSKPAPRGKLRVTRPDGTARDAEFVITADFLPGQHLLVMRDVTDQRVLEDKFRQAQKMEAVGRLAGGIAHDFNNLLNVITGYSELLLRRLEEKSDARRKAGEIVKAADRAARLTSQLLAFSRRQVLQPRVFDLNGAVLEMKGMLARLIREDIVLETRLDPALGRVKADPGQFEQVLMNLAINARDAMPHGGRLGVETRNVDVDEAGARRHVDGRAGAFVVLRVTDTGVGMDEETRRQVFEPFFTTKGLGHGTGLGLATVYGIVQQSDGWIRVESEPRQGTTFEVFLPRVDAPVLAAPAPAAAVPTPGGAETILLVEDEETLRGLARETLEAAGYRVLAAGDAEEALRVAREYSGPVHLLLTDVIMPGVNGAELARQLLEERPDMRVIFASGYTDDILKHRGASAHGNSFLQKPYGTAALETMVREILDAPAPR
jgi:two-component system cell cycle sensor histidine kinase/response regulator CckA